MSPHVSITQVGIVVTKTLTLLLGGLITYYSYRAYRRTGARELQALAWGFAIMTVGGLLGGLIDLGARSVVQEGIIGAPAAANDGILLLSVLAQSILTTVAFGVILYSLYVE